jgi:hypothetical protein
MRRVRSYPDRHFENEMSSSSSSSRPRPRVPFLSQNTKIQKALLSSFFLPVDIS